MKHYKDLTPEAETGIKEKRGFWSKFKSWFLPAEPVCPWCGPRGELVHMIESDGAYCVTCDMPIHIKAKNHQI